MANKILNLDFSKDPIMPPIIYGRVGDEKMQTITVKISRRDEIPDLSGGVITFEGEPAGGKVKVFDSENVSSNNVGLQKGTFEYTFPSAAFSVEGTYKRAYFSFQKDGKRDTTGDFKIIVKGNADIDAGEAETIITEYNRLVEKLNKAYQDALKKINSDYDVVVARIEEITIEITKLKAQISETIANTEKRISQIAENTETSITTIGRTVTEAMNQALEELHAADFYTKDEADSRFVNKTATENGLFVRKTIEITDLNNAKEPGIYSILATGVENKPLPNSGSLIVNKDPGGVRQLFQTERTVFIRQFGGIPSNWTDWKEVAFTTNVVNLTESQTISGVKDFVGELKINGIELNSLLLNPSSLEQIKNVGKKIWSGAWYMGENQSITPSLPLDKCLSGWLFLYQPYDSESSQGSPWDMNYVFVPKTHIAEFGGRAVVHHLETLNGSKYNKYIYISNTQILGHKNNNTASKEFVLTRVYAI
jgi:hypothetical protein